MRTFLPLVAVATLLATWPAAADNTADEADLAFRLGNQAFQRGQYEQALSAYFLSHRLVPNANVLFNIARCFEALEQFDEAYRYYGDLARLQISAEDRRDVERALVRIRPRVALVRIDARPVSGDIFIDREDLGARGRTPQTLALPPGKHLVRVKAEGYYPAQAQVTLTRGREVAVELELTQITGTVEVSGSPVGAWIRDAPDGPVLARIPARIALPPGRRVLYVGADEHVTSQLLVEVAEKQVAALEVTLSVRPQPTGRLVVVANRDNATIRVEGKPFGFTPTVLTLPEGEHTIEVSAPALRTFARKVQVRADAEERLVADLRYAPPPVQAASKTLLSVEEAPASTTVISAEELRAFGYTTVGEALQAVRGVFTADDRMYQKVGVRGLAPPGDLNNRVLILWDGHSMNDVWAGQGYAGRDLALDLAEVERIEVVRGPGSALYGSGAFFGVINLVPREKLMGDARVEGIAAAGGLGSYRGRASAALTFGQGGTALLSLAAYDAAGAELTDLGPRGVVRGLDGESGQSASARLRHGDLTLLGRVNRRVKDIPTGPFETLLQERGTSVTDLRGFAELRYEPRLGTGQLSLRGYFDASRYDGAWTYRAPEGPGTQVHTDGGGARWLGAEARYQFPLFERNQLTVGVEAQWHLLIEQDAFGAGGKPALEPHQGGVLSAYLLDEWRLTPALSLSAGLRVDRYAKVEALPLSPRLALIARPYERGLTKVVAGSAFRAPNVYELHYHDGLLTRMPAPSLRPETITTFELEHAHDLTEEMQLTLAGYHNRISDLVETDLEGEGRTSCAVSGVPRPCEVNVNVAGVMPAFGAEVEVRWQPSPVTLVNLSYSRAWISYPRRDGSSARPTGAPAHLAAARALLPLGPTARLAMQGTWQSRRVLPNEGGVLPELLLLNLGVTGDAGPLRYYAGVTNLLDQKGAPQLGRPESASTDAVAAYGRGFLFQLTGAY